MEFANQLILVASTLLLLSIAAGLLSSRIGAPLLLVFLVLGMLAGEEGPGGLAMDDYQLAYTVGAVALAIILFDGGVRTRLEALRLALSPAVLLATVGVLITAGLTGLAAAWLLDLHLPEALLLGSIVASTDAAAVLFLLHSRGTTLVERVRTTLEVESGLNDPMAVFLTVSLVGVLQVWTPSLTPDTAVDMAQRSALDWALQDALRSVLGFAGLFALQLVGGAAIGLLGGLAITALINRLRMAAGLYPVLAAGGALLCYALAQNLGSSGFLAVFIAGVVVGNRRHRAMELIERFQDALAWLSQIAMFLMLGLLVTPSHLLQNLVPGLALSAFLIVIARPVAVLLCLLPFGFSWRERAFVSWVGLRGAVPIFLGTIPVLAGVPQSQLFFEVAFLVVLTSLLVQGWTVNGAAAALNLALPPAAAPSQRFDIDLPDSAGRDMAVFVVDPDSVAAGRPPRSLAAAGDAEIVAVIRDGRMHEADRVSQIREGDYVLAMGTQDQLRLIDRSVGRTPPGPRRQGVLGEFAFRGEVPLSEVAQLYGVAVPGAELDLTLDAFMRRHIRGRPVVGDRLRIGAVELVVRETKADEVTLVGLELDPRSAFPLSADLVRIWTRHAMRRIRHRMRRLTGRANG